MNSWFISNFLTTKYSTSQNPSTLLSLDAPFVNSNCLESKTRFR
jgi:hypothetical protein